MKGRDDALPGYKVNWAAGVLFALLVAVFYWQVLFQNKIFVFVDASRFFYPLWKWGSDVLKQGWIPLWNPDAQFGTPYLADPQMAYAYPPVPLLYDFLSPLNAFAGLIILHHFWALLGFWVFARHEGFSGKSSFLGSLIFGFSLHVVCSSWTPVALMTISWIPWVFFAAGKIWRGEKGGFLYLSFAWAMQLAAGYPVLVYLTVLIMGLEFIWKCFQQPVGRAKWFWSKAGVLASAGAVALTYNLVWGLPFAEFLRLSNYENGASRYQDLGWTDLATALNPFIQGHPLGDNYHGPHYWVSTYFFGIPAVCLLLWGFYRKAYRKASWPLFWVILVLSLGVLGAGKILKWVLPGYSLVIHSGFWISLLVFWAAWMSTESAESLIALKDSKKQAVPWIAVLVLVYGAALLLGGAGFSFLILVFVPFVRQGAGRYALVLSALVFSLLPKAEGLNILLDRSYYEESPAVLSVLGKDGRLFFTPPLLKEAALLQGENMPQAYEMAKQKLYPNWPLVFGREETPIYNTFQLRDSFAWTFDAFHYSLRHSRKVLDYLNVRYVFGKSQFKDFKKIGTIDSVDVYENPSPMPKWFLVDFPYPEGNSLQDDFTQADKMDMNYSNSCFWRDLKDDNYFYSNESGKKGKLEFLRQGPNRLELSYQGADGPLVGSSEAAYPGWKAWAGGKERKVETVNHSFRGIYLYSGDTEVVFRFEPVTFRLGLFCTLLILGFWTSLILKKVYP